MRFAIVAGVAAMLVTAAGCGAYRLPSGQTATGTVSGSVSVYPCAPVEQQDQPCSGKMGTGFELTFTGDSTSQTASVDANGRYSVVLPAGTWKVSVKSGIARIVSGPATVTVPSGGTVQADYVIDSGIRMPQQQSTA